MHAESSTPVDWFYLSLFAVLMIGMLVLFWIGFKKLDDSDEEDEDFGDGRPAAPATGDSGASLSYDKDRS
ncbi:hypothetical protein HGI30_11605 [Paenibacillus albicereus]|uniref:Uncharacterized protein n=1 Tax=Paenibacillus albicereus TaxID=2726185 RepID=A0A6H2GYE0_9BACL|nr:hypothetical protein [Paenibacillus albicereus]QJC52138.1 hypothetical protein HGI30_11605 [Paenibacillus albicereus]